LTLVRHERLRMANVDAEWRDVVWRTAQTRALRVIEPSGAPAPLRSRSNVANTGDVGVGRRANSIVVAALASVALLAFADVAQAGRAIVGTAATAGADGIVVDSNGDAIAGGYGAADLMVIKRNGADGAELWRARIPVGAVANGAITTNQYLATDGANDVYVAGYLRDSQNVTQFAVVKLSGATGVEDWQSTVGSVSTSCC